MATPVDFDRIHPRAGSGALKYDAREAVFGRGEIVPLWVADMDFATAPEISAAIAQRAAHPLYGYSTRPESMKQALVSWMARHHGWQPALEWVRFSPGLVSAIYMAVQAFTRPGEGVIVQSPVYFPFYTAIRENDRRVLNNPLRLENGRYRMDLVDLKRQIEAGARLLLLCSPHNPGGRVWSREELEALLTLCREKEVVILSDEIHCDLVYSDHTHTPLASLPGAKEVCVTLLAPSKTFNTAGLTTAAVVIADERLQKRFDRIVCGVHLAGGNLFGDLAFEVAYTHGEAWHRQLMAYLEKSRDLMAAFVADRLEGIEMVVPEATYLAWLDCRALGLSDRALRRFFIQKAGLGLNPGLQFGRNGSGFMRLNFALPRARLFEALERLERAL